jgi:hypothetical protein
VIFLISTFQVARTTVLSRHARQRQIFNIKIFMGWSRGSSEALSSNFSTAKKKKKVTFKLGTMLHACNPSSAGSVDGEDHGLRSVLVKTQDPT